MTTGRINWRTFVTAHSCIPRYAQFQKIPTTREHLVCAPERFWLSQRQRRTRRDAHSSSFLARHSFALGSAVRTFVSLLSFLKDNFFLKNSAQHRASVDEKKNHVRHTIFRSYCPYYSRHAIVVTTVAKENHMTTDVIFFLIYGSTDAQCRAPIFEKNHMYFAHGVSVCYTKLDTSCDVIMKVPLIVYIRMSTSGLSIHLGTSYWQLHFYYTEA